MSYVISGAERMCATVRLFVPNETEPEISASKTLIEKLTNVLNGMSVSQGNGVYRMRGTSEIIHEKTLVVDIILNSIEEIKIKEIVRLHKEYGLSAHEETILFNLNGVSYISKPEELEVV